MDKDGFQFDLVTQRFIKNRWETDIGKKVLQNIIDGIKDSIEIRAILDDYVLIHEENIDPYGHPIYPIDAIKGDSFWVLTQDDLRGANFYSEDFSNKSSLRKKALSYCKFYNCNLEKANLDRADLSFAQFNKCNLNNTYLSNAGGYNIKMINCTITGALMQHSGFIDCDFSGSDLTNAFFEDSLFENLKVNYLTKFDVCLRTTWEHRNIPNKQIPDLLRSIRIGYEKAELWTDADIFLFEERKAVRKFIIWGKIKEKKSIKSLYVWLLSYMNGLFSGYSTKPIRIIFGGVVISLIFAIIYSLEGSLSNNKTLFNIISESIYFSFTTFATLGYGDISFSEAHPYMRILSTLEAWSGAIVISLFVAVFARKVFR